MRVTFGDLKSTSRISEALNLNPDDPRLASYVNQAQQELLNKGKWFGTYAKYHMCAQDGCITFPRQIATLETAAICGRPIPVHDLWFEFLEAGFGVRENFTGTQSGTGCCGGACGMEEANYRGRFPAFDDVHGPGKKLQFVVDRASDICKPILALGYDDSNNWIRTEQNGTIRDGELICPQQSPGALTSNNFSVLTDLQFSANMDGQTWLFEFDPVTFTQRMIGQYEYDDIRPSYARYYFPSIRAASDCSKRTLVEVIAKLDFIPVKNDTDYLIISNLPALKYQAMAVKKFEEATTNDDLNKASGFALMALSTLNSELDHYLGAGRNIGINMIGSSIGSIDPIPTLI